ncbi:MAG: thermonuclease family protein [Pirellulales bacterium]
MNGRPRRRFRRRPVRSLVILLALALLIAARYFFSGPAVPTRGQPLPAGTYPVERVVDGDTLLLRDDIRVRLIGVDTPETVRPEHPVEPFGPEAAQFTRAFLSGGQARLTFDREREDRYGRKLAYVWVDRQLLNEELLRAGLARWERGFDYAEPMKRRFQQAERQAQNAGRGIWSSQAADGAASQP